MKTSKQNERASLNKCNEFDIISKMIDMQLEDIAGDILSNLSDMDIANAVLANPEWSAIATGRARVKRLFSRNKRKNTPLKMFYRREEQLARQMKESTDARSLFLRASTKCSNLDKFRASRKNDEFRLVFPFDCSAFNECQAIRITDELIVVAVSKQNGLQHLYSSYVTVLLFDRWTFELVNSLSIACNVLEALRVIHEDVINALYIQYYRNGEIKAFLWDLATGKLHALSGLPSKFKALVIGKLIVLKTADENIAYVYRVSVEGDSVAACFLGREPLPFAETFKIPGVGDLGCVAVAVFNCDPTILRFEFQMRSKEDFSLLRTVTEPRDSTLQRPSNAFVLNECFAFVFHRKKPNSIDVVALVAQDWITVYRFIVPQELLRELATARWTDISTTGRFLVLDSSRLKAVIWKLPNDFIKLCQRHLKEGTLGVGSQCDQLVIEEIRTRDPCVRARELESVECRFDRFGILKCSVTLEMKSAFMDVAMLDSIISDDDCF